MRRLTSASSAQFLNNRFPFPTMLYKKKFKTAKSTHYCTPARYIRYNIVL